MRIRLGLDFSNYSGIPSPEKLAELRALGFDFAIVGSQDPDETALQIEALLAAGFEVLAVYCFLYWDEDDLLRVSIAASFGLPVILDCEWQTSYESPPRRMPDSQALEAAIQAAKDYLVGMGQYGGIYTGYWWWRAWMSYITAFGGDPLWYANYTEDVPDFATFVPFNGWTHARIWQYSSRGAAGVNVDLNAMLVEDETPMKRLNGIANPTFWKDRILADATMPAIMDLKVDFPDLPADAVMIRLEVYLFDGALHVLDGGTGMVAGMVGWGRPPGEASYGQIDVDIRGGGPQLRAAPNARIALLGIVGYWSSGIPVL